MAPNAAQLQCVILFLYGNVGVIGVIYFFFVLLGSDGLVVW